MSAIDRKRLRELAVAATPGPWRVSMSGFSVKSTDADRPIICSVRGGPSARAKDVEAWLGIADYLATANPTTVLALLDELEAAEAAYKQVRGYLQMLGTTMTERDEVMRQEYAALIAEKDARIAALEKVAAYAMHRRGCGITPHDVDARCTCGLDAAKREAGL